MRFLPWLIVGLAVLGSIATVLIVDQSSHSVSDTLSAALIPAGMVWLVTFGLLFALRRATR